MAIWNYREINRQNKERQQRIETLEHESSNRYDELTDCYKTLTSRDDTIYFLQRDKDILITTSKRHIEEIFDLERENLKLKNAIKEAAVSIAEQIPVCGDKK